MSSIIKTEQYLDYTIEISYDDYAESPREWRDWSDNLGTIYCAHKEYDIDGHLINELFNNEGEINYEELNENYVFLPIFYYEHSGITLSTGVPYDAWDSGFFGIIAVKKTDAQARFEWSEFNDKRKSSIEAMLRNEIEELSQYLNGEIYRYDITDKNGRDMGGSGEYYDMKDCLSDAKDEADYLWQREMRFEDILSTCGVD